MAIKKNGNGVLLMASVMRDRLIVGLDVADIQQAEKLVDLLGDTIGFYKIGYQLLFAGGLEFARALKLSLIHI